MLTGRVSDDADSVQMLQRSTQVGEYYRMMPPHTWDPNKLLPASYMDITIYDEEADKHVHIPFEQAMYACCLSEGLAGGDLPLDGEKNLLCALFGMPADVAVTKAGVIARLVALKAAECDVDTDTEAGSDTPFKQRGGADTLVGPNSPATRAYWNFVTRPTIAHLVACVKEGIWLPMCITIARPFIEHLTMSAIMTVSGRDTGATLFGYADRRRTRCSALHPNPSDPAHNRARRPADMQISANTSVKTIEGASRALSHTRTPLSLALSLSLC